ncbi:hypothetical protein BXY58_0619 [Epilithonimonas arachidiradicis]|uniref:Uncharacterized protein n=1 Tax=Epilithonimonas arachidiradicis TaxID=1617282 RepID=A0A420DDX2_9FLAO|nr:hypothetical protein BXY58_0619 [Epilithonimonas arachidiradicis]
MQALEIMRIYKALKYERISLKTAYARLDKVLNNQRSSSTNIYTGAR